MKGHATENAFVYTVAVAANSVVSLGVDAISARSPFAATLYTPIRIRVGVAAAATELVATEMFALEPVSGALK
jgi:hypothetical protein